MAAWRVTLNVNQFSRLQVEGRGSYSLDQGDIHIKSIYFQLKGNGDCVSMLITVCLFMCVVQERGREGEMDGGSVREGQATNVCKGR